MWSAYFLSESRVRFVGDGDAGGYLRSHVDVHQDDWFAPAHAAFVCLRDAGGAPPQWAALDIGFIAPLQSVGTVR